MSVVHPDIVYVDRQDNLLGHLPIDEVYRLNKIPRIARVVLKNHQGQYLLQRRSKRIPTHPGCWDQSVAGHVDAGETYVQTAKRELQEELGIEGVRLHFIGKYLSQSRREDGQTQFKFNKVYLGKYNSTPTDIDKREVAEVKWSSYPKIKALVDSQTDQVADGLVDIFTDIIKS